ncbi:MAG: DNA polymerase III [Candidatus Levybacteria bacterium]|nr:DNA polymerase III [Candidatus Levybacteria bacterium]
MSNQEISKLLRNVAASFTIKNEKKFRFQIIAYQKASDSIGNLTSELKDLYKEEKLELLPGVGVSIRDHLIELFKTGKVKHFEWALKDIPKSVFVLLDIPGFGPKKAYRLVKEFGINDPEKVISSLEKIAKRGEIASLPGFGEKSQSDILRSINEFKKGVGKTTRMTLPYAQEIAEKIVNYLKKSKHVVLAESLGSLRRRMATVGDIDIAVASAKPKEVINHFVAYSYKDRVIEKGEVTASLLVSGGRQIDLMVQPPESFGSLLQHFTGSKAHNVALREFALKKGLSLSEYGIKKKNKLQKFETEEKFYAALGLDWIPPELRENTGEIEKALEHNLPKLVALSDIKGDLHIHSSYPIEPSHDLGKASFEEMLRKAISLGYEYIGFSEHNPSMSKHDSNEIFEIIAKRNKEIEQLNKSNKSIRVLKLLETDITPNGKLAISNECLDLLDATIVSIHSGFGMDKKSMTKRVLTGLSHKKAKILAHPTGRMLNERPGFDLDWEEIFDFCKKHNKALEINSWPSRLDLPGSIIKMAVENKVKMIINTDSHALWQMNLMKYGVEIARRGWATKNDILNTLGYNDFVKWLKGGE